MIISEKQIMQLIAIAISHRANCEIEGQENEVKNLEKFLSDIFNQQCEKLEVIE